MKLIVSIVLAIAASAAAANRMPLVAPKRQHVNSALLVRGGAIDKTLVAKSGAIVFGSYGGAVALAAPTLGETLYNAKSSPMVDYICQRSGTCTYTSVLLWWCVAIRNTSLNTAVSITLIPWLLLSLNSLLNDKPKKLGLSPKKVWMELLSCLFVFHATLTNASYANTAIKCFAIVGLVNGILLFCNPRLAAVFSTQENDDMVYFSWRNFSVGVIFLNLLMASLAFGVDSITAMGYSWLTAALGLGTMMFVTKDMQEQGIAMGPCYVWLIILSIVAGVLLY